MLSHTSPKGCHRDKYNLKYISVGSLAGTGFCNLPYISATNTQALCPTLYVSVQ
ncbi:hypothetical protein HSR121_0620 [Halapricum desulfuricans]|uniref:Uncharacterized protein n=1 Tax=Halapricum desulfuricans TaxID=2841257 RepID=A0A897N2M6_9EURY|nr:hypothetical protein HSR121_0620 [Halapricum desulfuricans]